MATIRDAMKNIGGYFTVDEIEAYGPEGLTLTIKDLISKIQVGEKGDEKPAVRFEEHAKLLILNKTRAAQLEELFGGETDPEGKTVKLVAENCKIGNRKQPMICIRQP